MSGVDLLPAPHGLFDVWSPDQAAECLEGISTALYARIWNDIVPLYEDQPRSEVPDDFGERCTAKYWAMFTAAERAELNAAAEREERDTPRGWGSVEA